MSLPLLHRSLLFGLLCPALALAMPDETSEDSAGYEEGFIQSFSLTTNGSAWGFLPIDLKQQSEDGSTDWSQVPTKEKYSLSPLIFYGAIAQLDTTAFTLRLSYEKGRGYGADFGQSSLLDLLFQLTDIKYLDRLRFSSTILHFVGGEALLVDRETEYVYDETYFELNLRRFSLEYQRKKYALLAQYLGYSIPRNIYLKVTSGSGENQVQTFYPISESLLKVDSRVLMFGAAIDNRNHVFIDGYLQPYDSSRTLEMRGGIVGGAGRYELRDLFFNRVIDGGWLAAIGFMGHIKWQSPVTQYLTVGTTLELAAYFFAPIGLPDDIDEELRADGYSTEGLSLDFGTVDIMGRAYGFARITF